MIGHTISHYEVTEQLGQGGMGVVYKARDLRLGRFVALKFLPRAVDALEEDKQRFIIEARAASALDHPNICTTHEIDETEDGQMFIVMGYYQGETLREKISHGPLPMGDGLDFAKQICRGVGFRSRPSPPSTARCSQPSCFSRAVSTSPTPPSDSSSTLRRRFS